ncbi:hypothetical protein F5B22DRAFT_6948 [Xylaria bambusicola]|uniref:uncharacterized protein n=1 Tax=Xylaria bambusicola TaxID=326684 RepID=UPI002008BB73|nr:uncharacterized protein F5B22DRAFT_6948 [Xylaria bambusicola]KAI0527843.1 hypothetical protein F5B22DRAFT_6948 [Xylaria bambusicola]
MYETPAFLSSPDFIKMSKELVPLTVIKGAGHEYIQLPEGKNALTADFHSIRTQTTDSPTYLTSGFYKIVAGPSLPLHYTCEETKYVLSGQIDVLDEATGIQHHLVPGDFAFFYVGSKVQFSTKNEGVAFYAVTRPVKGEHINLKGREESKSKSKL